MGFVVAILVLNHPPHPYSTHTAFALASEEPYFVPEFLRGGKGQPRGIGKGTRAFKVGLQPTPSVC